MNQAMTAWLVGEVGRLRGRREPDPGQMIAVFTGPPGYGKTHLFGRIEHQIGQAVFFVFVPAFDEEAAPLDHIRRHVVETLFRAPAGGHSPLEMALARICRPAFADYFADLPPTYAARHETMSHRLGESPEAVLEVVRQVKTLGPFLKLADSLVQVLPIDAGIARALALGWTPAPWSATARSWLQGEDLPDASRKALGLGEDGPASLDVLRSLPALFEYDRPMMICCDQIEAIILGENVDRINRFTASLMDLLQGVPAQIVISCFQDSWETLASKAFRAFIMRINQPIFRLESMKSDQATRLVKARLESWPGRGADRHHTWPFIATSIDQLVQKRRPTPRGLIQDCARQLDEWAEASQDGEIDLADTGEQAVDVTSLFLKEWNAELGKIRQDPERTADYVSEERLYRGILEALKIAQSGLRVKDFGGVRIAEVRDKAVRAAAPNNRPGAWVVLAGGLGEEPQTVVVAVTKIEASRQFSPYLRALLAASAEPAVGAVMIHPKRDLDMVGQARVVYEAEVKAGRLRFLALEDYPLTYHATECLAALLDRAADRDLILGGVTLSTEDCRKLVLETGVIDNLDLFKNLGRWKRPAAKKAASPTVPRLPDAAGEATAPAEFPPVSVPPPVATWPPTQVATPPPSAKPEPPPEPKKSAKADLNPWAEKMLAGAVRKLNLLKQDVEPDGFEIGPTFARLRVRPLGKTNFKAVSNKAVDLRISLGLEVVPIVGSQAGCISIDIQRPDRAVVSLAEALDDAPANFAGQPAFPVGQDVAGQAHWLNLADPSDCHILVAGTTGSGKSEFLRAILATLASRLEPDRLKFVLIDPKRVTFNLKGNSPYLRDPIAYDLDEALPLIQSCMDEMDRRYRILGEKKLSNVSELPPEMLPRIVVIVDEFASFLEDKEAKKVVTALLKRIGAMARAAGIHLILSTQRPDRDVVTPLLRDNLPGRIALRVASKGGSDLILGTPEAEHLLGKGDLFWKKGGELLRLQSPFVPQAELERTLRCG